MTTAVSLSIRISRCNDVETLSGLHKQCLPYDLPPNFASGWYWVATNDGEPIAFAGLEMSRQWIDCGYLVRSGVVLHARGNGLQRKLIQTRERHARSIGLNWLVTDTYCNPASSNSLISCGYRMFDPSKPWAGKGALYWRKRL